MTIVAILILLAGSAAFVQLGALCELTGTKIAAYAVSLSLIVMSIVFLTGSI